jgi:hypothetical protein
MRITGDSRVSLVAVPSARNSGLESTEKLRPGWLSVTRSEEVRMSSIAAAVRTGRVLFYTTIVWPRAALATERALASTHLRSLA